LGFWLCFWNLNLLLFLLFVVLFFFRWDLVSWRIRGMSFFLLLNKGSSLVQYCWKSYHPLSLSLSHILYYYTTFCFYWILQEKLIAKGFFVCLLSYITWHHIIILKRKMK
jgi:hypothetical protein